MSTTINTSQVLHTTAHAWTGTANNSPSIETLDGVEVRRNLVLNPGFGSGGIGSWGYYSNAPIVAQTAVVRSGTYAGQVTVNTGATSAGATLSNLPVVGGTAYVASAWVNVPADLSVPYAFYVLFYDAANASLGQVMGTSPVQVATGGWQLISQQFTTPAAAVKVTVILMYSTKAPTVGDTFYLDDAMLELASTSTGVYFDGSTATTTVNVASSPLLIDGWQESADSRTIVNTIIGGGVDYTLYPATLRSGQFVAVYDNEADAAAAFAMHQTPDRFEISDTDRPSIAMTYVVNGQLTRQLDDETREFWQVTIPYQEVDA